MLVSTIINRGHYLAFFNRKKDGMVGCLQSNEQAGEYITVTKNNSSGYEVENIGYITLEFNRKEKSITCYGGL